MSRVLTLVAPLACLWIVACGDKPATTSGPAEESTSAADTTSPTSGSGATESAADTSAGSISDSNSNSNSNSNPDPSTTSVGATSNDATSSPATTNVGTEDTGCNFICETTMGAGGSECDATIQDCPEGQKCTAASDMPGEPWNVNVCVDVTGEGQPGDPCDIEDGKYTGVDNCALGMICLLTDDDGKGGACVEFCDENMNCPITGAKCVVYNDGSLPICLVACDPLVQDCPDGQACYNSAGDQFVCFKESNMPGMGLPGDQCQYINQCQKGSFCAAAASVEGCPPESNGCCTPYCPVSGGNGPCNATEECIAFFEMGMAPPGYEDVGVCAIPG